MSQTTSVKQATPEAPAAPPARRPVFTPAERETFTAEDTHAATAMVGIMMTIFVLGLVGYIIIAVWAAGG